MSINPFIMAHITALGFRHLIRLIITNPVRAIMCFINIYGHSMMSVSLIIIYRNYRSVDWYLMKIRTTQPYQLRIRVRKQSTLQQRIIRKIDPRNNMPRMKCHLLGFGKEIIWIPVKRHLSNNLNRHKLLGY